MFEKFLYKHLKEKRILNTKQKFIHSYKIQVTIQIDKYKETQ